MDGEMSQLELLGYEDGAQNAGAVAGDAANAVEAVNYKCPGSIAAKCWRRLHSKELDMTPSQFRQALETLAFTDGSRMAVQLISGQIISGRFQTMLTNGDMVWFTEERGAEERQWLIDVTQIAAVAEPWRDTALPVSNDDPLVRRQGAAEVRNVNT